MTMTPEERAAFGKNFSNLNREEGIYQDVTNILQQVMPVPEGFDYDMWLGPAPWAPYTEKRCLFNFRFNYDYGGGRLADWGVHHCDIGHWAMGMEHSGPVEIEGNGEFPREGIWNTAITYKCKCTYANGVTMHVYDVAQPDCAVFFEGTEGTVLV